MSTQQSQHGQLTVLEESFVQPTESEIDDEAEPVEIPELSEQPSLYTEGEKIDSVAAVLHRRPSRFVRLLAEELDKDELLSETRLLDRLPPGETDDVNLASLFVFPDESVLFVGEDPTAKDAVPFFAFVVEPFDPIPVPTDCVDALDLLRPGAVRDAFEQEAAPDRQGEWWLLPTPKVPVGSVFRPGMSSRPYGPSPLGNHVPREYGFGVRDSAFRERAHAKIEALPDHLDTVEEIIDWVHRQHQKMPVPDRAPEWDDIQDLAEGIYVRGTFRHRDDDHFVENVGEQWHEALTHDMDVYTGDDYMENVRLD